jgi:hypothetical protein
VVLGTFICDPSASVSQQKYKHQRPFLLEDFSSRNSNVGLKIYLNMKTKPQKVTCMADNCTLSFFFFLREYVENPKSQNKFLEGPGSNPAWRATIVQLYTSRLTSTGPNFPRKKEFRTKFMVLSPGGMFESSGKIFKTSMSRPEFLV